MTSENGVITLNFQGHQFECFTQAEFREAGLRMVYRPVSNTFVPSEGLLLSTWVRNFPNTVLVTSGKHPPRIVVYVPKGKGSHKSRIKPQKKCGSGSTRFENLDGSLRDDRAYEDVFCACRRKLTEWGCNTLF
jgi:hypothetical protein